MRVLIVDDTPDAARMMALLVERAGHEPLVALSGTQAIDVAKQNRVDLVLLDLRMPFLDGYETGRRLRDEAGVSARIVAVSANQPDPQRQAEAGIAEHVMKPVRFSQLKELLE